MTDKELMELLPIAIDGPIELIEQGPERKIFCRKSPSGDRTWWVYNNADELKRVTTWNSKQDRILTRVVLPVPYAVLADYDDAGRLVHFADTNGNDESYEYDASGNQRKVGSGN